MKGFQCRTLFLFALLIWPLLADAQIDGKMNQKGRFWMIWGYNRSEYSTSDIHFTGPGYDFTLFNVEAHDDPEEFKPRVYANPLKLTIPQFNFRMGYQFDERFAVSLGWDHMKYVLDNGTYATISGTIDESVSPSYAGTYDNQPILLSNNFIQYEHTDGLNYLRLNLDRFDPLWRSKNGKHGLFFQSGVGIGAMLPWTDTQMFGYHYRNKIHLAGVGVSANAGLRTVFLKRFFVQGTWMVGRINMWDVITTLETDRASQKFNFFEWHFTAGAYLNLMRLFKKDCDTCPHFDD